MSSPSEAPDRRHERRLDPWTPGFDSRDALIEVLAAAAVMRSGKVLLLREEAEPYRKYWVLPEGYPHSGETLRDAAVREVREELGIDVTISKLLGVYEDFVDESRGRVHYVIVCFLARTRGDARPQTTPEAIDWAWVDPHAGMETALPVVQSMLAALAERK